ncbi:hypothetical protein KAC08_004079 [Salmonella enterica subsp. diarizonae serovar 60:k:z]|nr:hypothetical protein [Salmonella enterica subsp. diarizonae]EHG2951816.1 hypothetical protein [Salmonella enterica subsp. diarizonae serovar 53:r:z35]EHJ0298560.1 hypothetical protein [Salmonella enterica subsp. diarizonae serovar 60:k:z]
MLLPPNTDDYEQIDDSSKALFNAQPVRLEGMLPEVSDIPEVLLDNVGM